MKVLITGHKGFIGQNLVKYIQDNTDWEVRTWEWGDSTYPTVDGNDWVIHLGAISSTTEQDVDKVLKQNLEFSQWLHTACQRMYVNLQYSSSASVYGLGKSFSETAPVDPKTPYAWSKYLFERWASTQPHNRIVQGFRYFNVYGNHEEHKGNQASPISQFRWQAKQGKIKLFHNSGNYLRDFVAVEDICRVHVEYIKRVKDSGVWNIGTGRAVSFQHVADLISRNNNVPIEYVDMPDILKSSYQQYTCADLTKLEDALGSQRWISIEEWLDKYNYESH
jgi:ADP-L-glycero-D-manno-heptose 6-epimerase